MIIAFPFHFNDMDLALKNAQWLSTLKNEREHAWALFPDARVPQQRTDEIKAALGNVVAVETVYGDDLNKWPESANLMFRTASKYIERTFNKPWLWLEPDAVPLCDYWLDKIEAEYNEAKRPFMGEKVQVENVPLHMSGVAVYPAQMNFHFGGGILAHEMAWDVYGASKTIHSAHWTKLIQHAWKHPAFEDLHSLETQIRPEAVLFHSSKDGSLIDRLKERRAATRAQGELATPVNVLPDIEHAASSICDIFIKTYEKDFDWLEYCLRSIRKFATGFRNIVVLSPDPLSVLSTYDNLIIKTVKEYGPDTYLSQQAFKVHADTFTDADYILYMDSDTIFTRPITPSIYFHQYQMRVTQPPRVTWMMTPLEEALPDTQHAWKAVMRDFMLKNSPYEFMRRHPFVLPRWFLGAFRKYIEHVHQKSAEEYIMSRPYRNWSEFNCMGFFAWEFHRAKFHWVDTSKDQWPELTVDQRWSLGGLIPEIQTEWNKILSAAPVLAEPELPSNRETNPAQARESTKSMRNSEIPGLYPDSCGGRQAFKTLEGEQQPDTNLLPAILPYIKEGDTVVDAGAWIGGYTAAFVDKVGSGFVHAFEPNTKAWSCLVENAPQAKHYKVALGDRDCWTGLITEKGKQDSGYIINRLAEHETPIPIRMRTLDHYPIEPDFIKLDVEGSELKVLRGAEKMIERSRPKMVIEINREALERQGNMPQEIFDWLTKANYGFKIIEKNPDEIYNILALPNLNGKPDDFDSLVKDAVGVLKQLCRSPHHIHKIRQELKAQKVTR